MSRPASAFNTSSRLRRPAIDRRHARTLSSRFHDAVLVPANDDVLLRPINAEGTGACNGIALQRRSAIRSRRRGCSSLPCMPARSSGGGRDPGRHAERNSANATHGFDHLVHRINNVARASVRDDLGCAAAPECDHWRAACHRLGHHQPNGSCHVIGISKHIASAYSSRLRQRPLRRRRQSARRR